MNTREYILNELQREYSFKDNVDIDTIDFISEGYMDSIGLLQFIAVLEDEYEIEFTNDELSSPEFKIVGKLIGLVEKKLEEK